VIDKYLEFGIFARVESIHAAKALAWRPTAQQFHFSLLGQLLSNIICSITLST
jgi:hypothetical protein